MVHAYAAMLVHVARLAQAKRMLNSYMSLERHSREFLTKWPCSQRLTLVVVAQSVSIAAHSWTAMWSISVLALWTCTLGSNWLVSPISTTHTNYIRHSITENELFIVYLGFYILKMLIFTDWINKKSCNFHFTYASFV